MIKEMSLVKSGNLEAIKDIIEKKKDIIDDPKMKNICMKIDTTKSTDKRLFVKNIFQCGTKDEQQKYTKNSYKLI